MARGAWLSVVEAGEFFVHELRLAGKSVSSVLPLDASLSTHFQHDAWRRIAAARPSACQPQFKCAMLRGISFYALPSHTYSSVLPRFRNDGIFESGCTILPSWSLFTRQRRSARELFLCLRTSRSRLQRTLTCCARDLLATSFLTLKNITTCQSRAAKRQPA